MTKKLILALLAASTLALVSGCSTSSRQIATVPTPTVRFGGYIDAAGNAVSGKSHQATFEFENPSASMVVCAFQQPGAPREALISLQPNSTNRVVMLVGGDHAETVNVRMMQVASSRELSVSAP